MIEATTTNSSTTSLPPASAESSASPTTTVANTAAASKTGDTALQEVLSSPESAESASAPTKLQETIETIINLISRFLELLTTYLKSQGKNEETVTAKPAQTPSQTPASGQTSTSGQASTAGQTSASGQTSTSGQTATSGQTSASGQTSTSGQTSANTSAPTSNQKQTEKDACKHTITITCGDTPQSGTDNKTPANNSNSGSGASPTPVHLPPSIPTDKKHDDCCHCPNDKFNFNVIIQPPVSQPPKPTDPSAPTAPVTGKLKDVGSTLGASGEFLWKPTSEKDGKLAVLIPSSLTGKIDEVAIVSADKKRVLQKGKFSGVGNGNRSHYRFSKSGDKFPDGSIVWIKLKDGTSRHIVINETGARYTK